MKKFTLTKLVWVTAFLAASTIFAQKPLLNERFGDGNSG
jgi:hypothetical protein